MSWSRARCEVAACAGGNKNYAWDFTNAELMEAYPDGVKRIYGSASAAPGGTGTRLWVCEPCYLSLTRFVIREEDGLDLL